MPRLLLVLFVACAARSSSLMPVMPSTDRAALGPGDVFEVRVYQEPDLSGAYRIGSDGTIRFPLVGSVDCTGRTSTELGDLIADKLRKGYINNPQVSVIVKEYNSKKVFVLGHVTRPGAYPYAEDMNIVSAIAQAGGFLRGASPNSTNVTRVVDDKETRVTVRVDDIGKGREKNFSLAPGDIIYVPESMF